MGAVAAAPALALGPPGWVIFAVAVVATAGIAAFTAYELRSQTATQTREQTQVGDCTAEDCPRPWSVRVHAQGTDVGGTSGATIGAPAIIQTSPILVAQGIALAAATFEMLTSRQQRNLDQAYAKCVRFIETCRGFLGQKSFYGRSHDNNRFDVDSFGPSPNFIS
jgi:hypothetical protein